MSSLLRNLSFSRKPAAKTQSNAGDEMVMKATRTRSNAEEMAIKAATNAALRSAAAAAEERQLKAAKSLPPTAVDEAKANGDQTADAEGTEAKPVQKKNSVSFQQPHEEEAVDGGRHGGADGKNEDPEKRRRFIKRTQSKRLQEATTCPLCSKEYNHPKSLPCEHVFCLECIRPYVNPKNLASCPICRKEHLLAHGDPATLPDAQNALRLMKARHKLLKEKEPSSSAAGGMSGAAGGEDCCSVCQKDTNAGGALQFCKYSRKKYCALCFATHVKVLRTQLDQVTGLLQESDGQLTSIQDGMQKALANVDDEADKLLESRIEALKAARERLKVEAEKRQHKTQDHIAEVRKDIEKLVDSQKADQESSAVTPMTDKEIINRFIEVQSDFGQIRSRIEQITLQSKVELNRESFTFVDHPAAAAQHQALHAQKSVRRKTSGPETASKIGHHHGHGARRRSSTGTGLGKFGPAAKIKCKRIPTDAAVCPWNGQIFTCCPENKCIDIYEPSGKLLRSFDTSGLELLYPMRVAFSTTENRTEVLVLDKWSHTLAVLDYPKLELARSIGGAGGVPGKFKNPQGLEVDDETGNMIVADTGNDRVQVLTRSGRFLRFIGGTMVKDASSGRHVCQTELSRPEDVGVSPDGSSIAVADTGNNRVRLYTMTGQPLAVIGMRGAGNGQFDLPLSVVITPANLLVVGDGNNARLQVFTLTGQFQKIVRGYKNASSLRANPDPTAAEEDYSLAPTTYSLVVVEANNAVVTLLH